MEKLVFNLHFTDYCNFHCKHCFINKEGKELSLSSIKLIGKKLADYGNEHNIKIRVNLAGGEPLLSKHINIIISYLYSLGLEVSLITNGFYLNEVFIIQNRNRLSMIGISVDSLNDETNKTIGRVCNGKTLTNERLIEICEFIKHYGIKLKINTCITSLNLNEDINEFINVVEPDRFKLLRAYCDDNHSQFRITDKEWENIVNKYPTTSVAEDNDYMANNYLIIDSQGNLTKNNLHVTNNSLLDKSLEECFDNLKRLEEQLCQ